ncbi:sulfur carrier protein [Malonomonas rubra DSM 5091]|uniref:Sulfur carrier protein n=1 Tax=Malonomonas rubra DSM 5091 TaxID=1122189 RepID=A0A1M6BFC1_MALRU|nr:sulfur carrier protein ThiS [Malonomonas rubra]SHI47153.1 sulfur carrier protein [Malonomonas rubra DSM 5091]
MQLKINGQNREFDHQLSISGLLQQLQLAPERVVIELNTKILTAEAHETLLNDGDTLEIIQFVGGG